MHYADDGSSKGGSIITLCMSLASGVCLWPLETCEQHELLSTLSRLVSLSSVSSWDFSTLERSSDRIIQHTEAA